MFELKIIYKVYVESNAFFTYSDFVSANRWIDELIDIFEVSPEDIRYYAEAYDCFGNLVDRVKIL